MSDDNTNTISALEDRAPGEATADPYEDIDISQLPEWWQDIIEEFREYGLRPYRPPRFEDGVLKHEVIEELERELDCLIQFIGHNATFDDDMWKITVDREPIGEVAHRRSPAGYSVFEIESEEFISLVHENVDSP